MAVKLPVKTELAELEKVAYRTEREIETLSAPVATFFALHIEKDGFAAVELDHYRRVTIYKIKNRDPVGWLIEIAAAKRKKIVAVGFEENLKHSDLCCDLWLEHDIVPHIFVLPAEHSRKQLIQYARLTSALFSQNLASYPLILENNTVIPSFIANKKSYKKTASADTWKKLESLAIKLKPRKIRFFSATPQGGGVALMRHALIRLFRITGIKASWHVMIGNPDIFRITKMKFHDILQGVAPKNERLTNPEQNEILAWSLENAKFFKPVFEDSDIAVIDDYQPSGLIPYIKKANPRAKIIYRSHIQIESKLTDTPGTPQNTTWKFISNFIKESDLFVTHPVSEFIPENIIRDRTVAMPAVTDPLDGLNKKLNPEQTGFYINLFNKHLIESGQTPLDGRRPHIIQIARFDPSKGIPDLLEAYLITRLQNRESPPQLVICGHGSVDDPEGIPIYNYIRALISKPRFKEIAPDIKTAILPHNDQMLNALLSTSIIALQLSHKEGFEVKVTEALMKGIPVIAYRTGGIPLQINDSVNGFLIETGNYIRVAETIGKLIRDKNLYSKFRTNARDCDYRIYQTAANAARWLTLFDILLNGKNPVTQLQQFDYRDYK